MDVDLKIATCLLFGGISLAAYIDRDQIKAFWQSTVGSWFGQRRFVGGFNERRRKLFRIGPPDEHSPCIMVMRRDVSTGWWT